MVCFRKYISKSDINEIKKFKKEIEKLTLKKCFIFDSGRRNRKIFNEVIVFLEKRYKIMYKNKFITYILKFKLQNIWLLFWIIVWASMTVASSVILTYVLDAIISKNINTFLIFSIVDILCWLGVSYAQATKDIIKENLIQKELNAIRQDILEPLTKVDFSEFKKNTKSEYISWLVNDMNLLRDNGFIQFYGAVESIITVILNALQ
ncbi:Uncharacterised protein [Streptobacillus moniliformis]|nr:Uncharacterised protein [Streptobacillus moniliformis]